MTRTFGLAAPLCLHASNGLVGCWSRAPKTAKRFIRLNPTQATLLLQFHAGQLSVQAAADAARIDYDDSLEGLIEEFVDHGLLVEGQTVCQPAVHRFHHPELGDEDLCVVQTDAFTSEAVEALMSELTRSELVGDNPLSAGFAGTAGFALKFRTEARGHVEQWLPWLRPFLTSVLDDGGLVGVNACYLNALFIPPGSGTGIHNDSSMDGHTAPERVTILYLRTAEPPHGSLHLQYGAWPIAIVEPRSGMLVHFRGNLTHGVTETRETDPARVSLVCEQYSLNSEALRKCAYLEVITSGQPAASEPSSLVSRPLNA